MLYSCIHMGTVGVKGLTLSSGVQTHASNNAMMLCTCNSVITHNSLVVTAVFGPYLSTAKLRKSEMDFEP